MKWVIISDKENEAEFISLDVCAARLFLKVRGKSFIIKFQSADYYLTARQGIPVNAVAKRGKNEKQVKIVFK